MDVQTNNLAITNQQVSTTPQIRAEGEEQHTPRPNVALKANTDMPFMKASVESANIEAQLKTGQPGLPESDNKNAAPKPNTGVSIQKSMIQAAKPHQIRMQQTSRTKQNNTDVAAPHSLPMSKKPSKEAVVGVSNKAEKISASSKADAPSSTGNTPEKTAEQWAIEFARWGHPEGEIGNDNKGQDIVVTIHERQDSKQEKVDLEELAMPSLVSINSPKINAPVNSGARPVQQNYRDVINPNRQAAQASFRNWLITSTLSLATGLTGIAAAIGPLKDEREPHFSDDYAWGAVAAVGTFFGGAVVQTVHAYRALQAYK